MGLNKLEEAQICNVFVTKSFPYFNFHYFIDFMTLLFSSNEEIGHNKEGGGYVQTFDW